MIESYDINIVKLNCFSRTIDDVLTHTNRIDKSRSDHDITPYQTNRF